MRIVHAAFVPGRLAVWMEPESGKAGLAGIADSLGLTAKFVRGAATSAEVWLPSVRGRAVPSSTLLGEAPDATAATIEPHEITILPLAGRRAIDVLAACSGKRLLAPGLLIGADL